MVNTVQIRTPYYNIMAAATIVAGVLYGVALGLITNGLNSVSDELLLSELCFEINFISFLNTDGVCYMYGFV